MTTPSKLLRRFLENGTRPSSQREASALLDESRSLLVSKLPTTGQTIQNFTNGEIDSILAGGITGVMDRAHAIYSQKEGRFVGTGIPLAKPAAKAPARPAPAPVASKPAPVINRATATTSKPAPATKAATPAQYVTAAEFAEPIKFMERSEWAKLSDLDKMRFFKTGGKLA